MNWTRTLVRRAVHGIALITRPMTLGARVLVTDVDDRILLIKHTYVPGWYMPGGGVDRGETMLAAARRELLEETGLAADGLDLFGLYFNRTASVRDHVALFRARGWSREREPSIPNREIKAIGFFDRHDLPEGTTASTLRRLSEIYDGAPVSEFW
ncbi:MAG: NUDIX domain-containing protein [Pseudomonadota bacterium]